MILKEDLVHIDLSGGSNLFRFTYEGKLYEYRLDYNETMAVHNLLAAFADNNRNKCNEFTQSSS